ncbi:TonB-dependent receptor domain-containing protein [Roseateles asaccharophilus]|uniref:Iron complex outermembrane receptor protein n=1 Tax=Roseateles asaccharophilus TaxID=582607 RepID=A0ABU2A8K5_9BURK|nr:TonB-dependent receptor [Roseateles asaccharophilus]MDR7333533.1 iron complex outermembrane receptor protein [Roseateles asaccharophilus]
MKLHPFALAALAAMAPAVAQEDSPRTALGLVTVQGGTATSLPTVIPTTLEGLTAADIARSINATDAEDALKYLPSLLVRKRYPGDYNHAVLSTRASGTGNSARALVFVDGIPLANLLGNGASFTPRWGLVAPEDIARVDVLYGPFSAAYSGNSVGAVVDYQTRRPQRFEAHAEAGLYEQRWRYGSDDARYQGRHASASLADRAGDWSWSLGLSRHDNEGQPLTFPTRAVATTAPAANAVPVTGAVAGQDRFGQPWWLLGSATQMHTVQDQARLRLAWQATPELRAQLLGGLWRNTANATSQSWLRDAAGQPVFSGPISIAGRGYTLAANEFGLTRDEAEHRLLGATLKRTVADGLNWELAASHFDYAKDRSAQPLARTGGPGRVTRLDGSGWTTLAAKASAGGWEGGVQREHHVWRQRVDNASEWRTDGTLTPFTAFNGETTLTSAFAQRVMELRTDLRAVLGLRHESWRADHGSKTASTGQTVGYAARLETELSPKAALGWAASDALDLRVSIGRAVRWPTVGELFQGGVSSTGAYVEGDPVTNPGLKAERGWTRELSALWHAEAAELRATVFHENTHDALYSQSTVINGRSVSSVQNIGRIETLGLELAGRGEMAKAWRWQASLTYADSTIQENAGFVAAPGDTVGKQQPRVPRWRASALISYAITQALDASFGARYGSSQYGNLNNADFNGMAYQGFSRYLTADVKLNWRITRQWSASLGVDNINDAEYWNFHPYPGRTVLANVRFDL